MPVIQGACLPACLLRSAPLLSPPPLRPVLRPPRSALLWPAAAAPDTSALRRLLTRVPQFKLDTLLDALPSLGPQLTRRLVSTVLYHVALGAALGPAELASQEDVATALEGAALLVRACLSLPCRQAASVQAPEPPPLSECPPSLLRPAAQVKAAANGTFPLTITDKRGTQARTLAGPAAAALEACGAAAYVVDQVGARGRASMLV